MKAYHPTPSGGCTPRAPCWDGKTHMAWVYNDGGRGVAGHKGRASDCVARAIAIAAELPYQDVCNALDHAALSERPTGRRKRSSTRTGVHKPTWRKFLLARGWTWHPTMTIGSGAQVHLCEEELPAGRLIVSVSRHLTAVLDHVIHDTHDPQRGTIVCENGVQRIMRRCVYGYFTPAR
jgi:hypothetical protein